VPPREPLPPQDRAPRHRFFVPPAAIAGEWVTFDSEQAHQLRSVLRLRPGARVLALDDSGFEIEVELSEVERDSARGRACGRVTCRTEPALHLTLYQGVLKGDHMEWVLQKGTELGVSAFVPLLSARSVVAGVERIEKKRPRWERIIREAAEQSHRGRLPRLLAPLPFDRACQEIARAGDAAWIPWEEAAGNSLVEALRAAASPPPRAALLIGSEGGFEAAEVREAQAHGITPVTLGPRILRAETAALAAATLILAAWGEMEARR
jgi:16S rRNA (uracil1498-N3)-methyltransferase